MRRARKKTWSVGKVVTVLGLSTLVLGTITAIVAIMVFHVEAPT